MCREPASTCLRNSNPDLVTVAARIPRGVLCLISALAFHELTRKSRTRFAGCSSAGTRSVRLPARSPNLNAFAERFVFQFATSWASIIFARCCATMSRTTALSGIISG